MKKPAIYLLCVLAAVTVMPAATQSPTSKTRQDALQRDRIYLQSALSSRPGQRPAAFHTMDIIPSGSVRWQYFGPSNVEGSYRPYEGVGAISGRVNDAVVARDGTIYLASASGGVWKSDNSGKTWTALMDAESTLMASCIALSESGGRQRIYAGDGDFDETIPVPHAGIRTSDDCGLHWIRRGDFGLVAVSRIAVDPQNPGVILAATGRGSGHAGAVWKSTDYGQNFQKILHGRHVGLESSWSDVTIGRAKAGQLPYYYAANTHGEVWRSTDGGNSWIDISPDPNCNSIYELVRLGLSPSGTVYAAIGVTRSVYFSQDAGKSWRTISGNLNEPAETAVLKGYALGLTVTRDTATGSDSLFYGSQSVHVTSPAGWIWTDISHGDRADCKVHIDIHRIVPIPGGADMLVCGDGGIYRMWKQDGNWSFKSLNANLRNTQVTSVAAAPSDPLDVLIGSRDNGALATYDHGKSWYSVSSGDCGSCLINPTEPSRRMFIAWGSKSSTVMSIDADNQFSRATAGSQGMSGQFYLPIVLSPSDPTTAYWGDTQLTRYSTYWGAVSETLGSGLISDIHADDTISAIDVSAVDPLRIYTGSQYGVLSWSGDCGRTWDHLRDAKGLNPAKLAVTSIYSDPKDPDTLILSLGGEAGIERSRIWLGEHMSNSGRRKWTPIAGSGLSILPDVAIHGITLDPRFRLQRIFAATDVGVFATLDGGKSWWVVGEGLPGASVRSLALSRDKDKVFLYAATYGRGVWRIELHLPPA